MTSRSIPLAMLCVGAVLTSGATAAESGKGGEESVGPLFEKVTPTLEQTLKLLDKQETLPKRTYLIGEDQRSNRRKIDRMLEEAIQMLGVSGLVEDRKQIRQVEGQVRQARQRIAGYQRKKVSAPKQDTLGALDKANPFVTTKEGYDKKIESERD